MDDYDRQRHKEVFERAMGIYEERDKIRGGLWKQYHALDQLRQAKIKIERCLALLEDNREEFEVHIVEEIPDIINYVIYAHRQVAPGAEGP